MIGRTSRYFTNERATYVAPDGTEVPYLRRRFLPDPDSLPTLVQLTVTQGMRLDLTAARLLGDPLRFWRIADANTALDPFELVEVPGRSLRVPQPGS